MARPCLLAAVVVLLTAQVSGDVVKSPCSAEHLYAAWLSKPEAFVRKDQPKGLQGLHVACVWRSGGEDGGTLQLEAYRDALDVAEPEVHSLPDGADGSWKSFRAALAAALKLKKKTNDWGHLELKQVFGVFAAHGHRLSSVTAALDAQLIFVIVGGQWFWPPVYEGYVRQLEELQMELVTLSVAPVAYQVRGFLQDRECEEIIKLGGSRMQNSPVSLMDKDKGKAAKEFRTSTQARVDRAESQTLRGIDERVSMLTGVPKAHNEEVQILRYDKSQYYSAHLDNWDPIYYSDSGWFEHGHNNRFITVFWYLTSVDKGGETIFPRAHGLPQPHDMWSCQSGLKVKPVKGTVIFWYSLHPNGNTDPNGLHAACPVEEGQKWSANYWVWNKPRYPRNPGALFAEQEDEDQRKFDPESQRVLTFKEMSAKYKSKLSPAELKRYWDIVMKEADGQELREAGGFGFSIRACAGLAVGALIAVSISLARRIGGGSKGKSRSRTGENGKSAKKGKKKTQ